MKCSALALSSRILPGIYRMTHVGFVSRRDIRRFRCILHFVTYRLEFTSLEELHRMACPLHLFRPTDEQQRGDTEEQDLP